MVERAVGVLSDLRARQPDLGAVVGQGAGRYARHPGADRAWRVWRAARMAARQRASLRAQIHARRTRSPRDRREHPITLLHALSQNEVRRDLWIVTFAPTPLLSGDGLESPDSPPRRRGRRGFLEETQRPLRLCGG